MIIEKLRYIDLFSGIGGLRYPLTELENTECVFSSEIDPKAIETYYQNFGDIPNGDITKIDPKDIPNHDLLLGGFPCQPFSFAGKKKGFDDERGKLIYSVINILKVKKPKYFILENVKGFISKKNFTNFLNIIHEIEKIGYKINWKILNSKDFGLPQNRERVYIVGKMGNNKIILPNNLNTKTSLFDILESNIDDKYTISNRLWEGHKIRKEKYLKKGYGFGYKIFDKDSVYVSTLSRRYYKDGSEILIKQNNKNPRRLTPREVARLQGFPDTFILNKSDIETYKQMGNAVSINVSREVIRKIYNDWQK